MASELLEVEVSANNGAATLPSDEIDRLREFFLSGDVAGIRRHLDAWRETGGPGDAREIIRRLESLVAAYDMDGLHELLLTIQTQDGS